MAKERFNFYRFLPVQLFLLHFRRYQLLLVFWVVLFTTIMGKFMSHFGASSLFLAPEYLGSTNILGFTLLGGATAIFIMSWHITTFIIHSKRIPFLGATRQSFLKYCYNNSTLPLIYLIIYGVLAGRYLSLNEGYHTFHILYLLLGFVAGLLAVLIISFLYFFRVDRNILKTVLSSVSSLSAITELIPFDALDTDFTELKVNSYVDGFFKLKKIKRPYRYNNRFLNAVLRRHNRNAVFAIVIAYILLLVLGIYMDLPILRIPAACGFLLLFSIVLTFVASFKYLLRSWEIIGWILVFFTVSFLAKKGVFDLRSVAYGINYTKDIEPEYSYDNLSKVFPIQVRDSDRNQEMKRLDLWKINTDEEKPTAVVVAVSGGGSRSAYWSFRCLQYADSLTKGKLFPHTIMMTGASGGMIGAAYWRSVHTEFEMQNIENPYQARFQNNIGKDLLNAIVFSMAAVDLISPFNKITVNGHRYGKDRGYAFDQELGNITEGMLSKTLGYYQPIVAMGRAPLVVINGTIINDGRKLMMASQPIGYLTASKYADPGKTPVIDAVGFNRFFKAQDPLDLKLSSALRMSATFPIILPVVKLPSQPNMDIMDAGLRDNYGAETSIRYVENMRDWLLKNAGKVVYIQIRDSKESAPTQPVSGSSLTNMMINPLFAIQQKWSSFQTFEQTYLYDELQSSFPPNRLHKIVLEFEPQNKTRTVALNFHLSDKDKQELLASIYTQANQIQFRQLVDFFNQKNN